MLEQVRIRTLPNRNRLELQVRHGRAELSADDLKQLLRQLAAAGVILFGGGGLAAFVGHASDRLLRHLRELAEAGACMPTNQQLAERLELGDRRRVADTLKYLQQRGNLEMVKGPAGGRVVRFPDGRQTAARRRGS